MLVKQARTTYLPAIAADGGQAAIHDCQPVAPPGSPPPGPPNSGGDSGGGGVRCIALTVQNRVVTICIEV